MSVSHLATPERLLRSQYDYRNAIHRAQQHVGRVIVSVLNSGECEAIGIEGIGPKATIAINGQEYVASGRVKL